MLKDYGRHNYYELRYLRCYSLLQKWPYTLGVHSASHCRCGETTCGSKALDLASNYDLNKLFHYSKPTLNSHQIIRRYLVYQNGEDLNDILHR